MDEMKRLGISYTMAIHANSSSVASVISEI